LEERELDSFQMLTTRDESWFVSEDQHSTKWSVAQDEVPTRVSRTIGAKKIILTVILGIDGFHVVDMMLPGGLFNAQYFFSHIMDSLMAKVLPEGRKSHTFGVTVYLDYCWVHSSNASKQFLMEILSLLFLIPHTVLTWHRPTSGFSAISRHLLKVVYSLTPMSFLRESSGFERDSAL
jgi:hypothetical protein